MHVPGRNHHDKHLSLFNDALAGRISDLLNGVRQLIQGQISEFLKQFNISQQSSSFGFLLHLFGGKNATEGLPVQRPQLTWSDSANSGGSVSPVQKSQLAKGSSLSNDADLGSVLDDLGLTGLENIKQVTRRALR